MWTFCDEVAPERGFCVALPQAKEIRLRHKKALAERDLRLVDERERRLKVEARLEASEASKGQGVIVAVGVGVGALLLGLVIGGVTGALAF